MTLRESIKSLRDQGKNYNEIVKELGCSKGTVSYHCSEISKTNTDERTRKWRRKNMLSVKIHRFRSERQKKKIIYGESVYDPSLNEKNLRNKFGANPKCYITGTPINLDNGLEYSLDHIIPLSKGGQNTLENCGLTSFKANRVKTDLTYEELIDFCKIILKNKENG